MSDTQRKITFAPLKPYNKLKKWPISKPLQSWLDRIGFGFLSKLNQDEIRIDRKLVTYLVNSYNKNSSCFEFNGVKLFFSLIDVYMLTGLPVTGKPVLGHIDKKLILFDKAFPSVQIMDYKDTSPIFEKGKIKTTWLLNRFSSLQVNEGDSLWNEYRRAFFLWCISAYIVPDASTAAVEIEYTTILGDLEDIGKYAWGAAAWATMQHQLKSGRLNGLAYAVVLFIALRVKPLYDLLLSSSEKEPDVKYQFPLLLIYLTPLTKAFNHLSCLKNTPYAFLEELHPEQVIQNPYGRFPLHSSLCIDQLARACSVTLCFNRVVVEPHEPNRIPGQFGFEVVYHEFDLPNTIARFPKKGPKKERDLNTEYEIYAKLWNDRTPLRGRLLVNWEVQPWMEEYRADRNIADRTLVLADGYHVPYRTSDNLNSPPRQAIANAELSVASSFPFTPVTPDQQKQLDHQIPSERLNVVINECSSQEKDKQWHVVLSSSGENENTFNEFSQIVVDATSAAISTPQKETNVFNEIKEYRFDLNKTPD